MRRIVLLCLIALLVVALALPAAAQARGISHACGSVTLETFPDIDGFPAGTQEAIGCLGAYDVTGGYQDGTYRPTVSVQRYQMALFLARVLSYADVDHLPPVESQGFVDIGGLSDEAQDSINLLGTVEITTGTATTRFSPHADVSRRDMASFLVRMQQVLGAGYSGTDGHFVDVPDSLERSGDVNALAAEGIVGGYADGTYGPYLPVRRAEMALFIMRHLDENIEAGRLVAVGAGAGESRGSPVPLGDSARVGSWEFRIVDTLEDATEVVLAENQFNDPPASGKQFYMPRLSATYVGQGSSMLFADVRIRGLDDENVSYVDYVDTCGVIPNELPEFTEVFEGGTVEGNLCWEVSSATAHTLVMYIDDDSTIDSDQRVWFALR